MSGNSQDSEGSISQRTERLPTTNDNEHTDTQRSLQQASLALEVAYDRIRQVRRSLLQLSESLPNSDISHPQLSTNNDIRPGHEALVLSGDMGDAHPMQVLTRRQPPTPGTSGESSNSDTWPDFSIQSITSLPQANVLPPRFSRRDHVNDAQNSQRLGRVLYPDSASTTRGLRVAARMANIPGQENNNSNIEFAAYSAEYDRILGRAHQRLDTSIGLLESSSNTTFDTNPSFRRQQNATRDMNILLGRAAPMPPAQTLLSSRRLTEPPRRLRRPASVADPAEHRDYHTIHEEIEALPPLVDFSTYPSFEPLPNNMQGSRSISSGGSLQLQTHNRPPVTATNQNRLVRESIRVEDLTPSDWPDGAFISWLFPGQDIFMPPTEAQPIIPRSSDSQQNLDLIRITRTTNTTISPENSVPRRGWARLDPDGNEIPFDEEEELERSRADYRVRALQRTRYNNPGSSNSPMQRLSQDPYGPRRTYGSVLDSTINIPEAHHRDTSYHPQGDISPLYVDPLPMPLSSMMIIPSKPQDIYVDIVVSKHSYLAGR